MADSKLLNRSNSVSPPPNCAICLGSCSNKCFSDTCMHQFCFNCLLQWSKIKPECPLCKQPFKSIIHNVKSNEEYEEHIVEQPVPVGHLLDNEQYHLILPPGPPPPSRHHRFHFRTTFTVNTHGENAIQRMLMSHSLTNGITISNYQLPHSAHYSPRPPRRRPRPTTTNFRRQVYDANLWASLTDDPGSAAVAPRDITPEHFRAHAPSRNRVVPWINRELNALLRENTRNVMEVVDVVMNYLKTHHICSRPFRNLLTAYLGRNADHFIHEAYTFMRSPYDMVGYDRHVNYYERPTTPVPFIDVSESEGNSSDVMIIEETPEIIEVHSSASDDDVIVTSSFVPKPQADEASTSKRSRQLSVSSSSSSEEQPKEVERPRKRKQKKPRHQSTQVRRSPENDSDDDESSSSVLDDVPLSKYLRIKASIGKKIRKKSSALAKSKDRSKGRKRGRSSSRREKNKKRTASETNNSSPQPHCSKYERRVSRSSSSSSSSSSSHTPSPEPRTRKNHNVASTSSCNCSERSLQPKIEIITETDGPSHGKICPRPWGRHQSNAPISPGEGPSNRTQYFPTSRTPSAFTSGVESRGISLIEPPALQSGISARMDRETGSLPTDEEYFGEISRILRVAEENSRVGNDYASLPSNVYSPNGERPFQSSFLYSDRTSPDLIDLSVTSRYRQNDPCAPACVPPQIRARYKESSPNLYNTVRESLITSQLPNAQVPSTSYAPYNYESSMPEVKFKNEPYSENQSEGSTKYWTDLSTQNTSHTNSNDSTSTYQNHPTRRSVIQNSRENPGPSHISPRWSSSNSPLYPSYSTNWSDSD